MSRREYIKSKQYADLLTDELNLKMTNATPNINFFNEITWGSQMFAGGVSTTTGIKIPAGQTGAASLRTLSIDLNKFNRKNRLTGQKLQFTISLSCTSGWKTYINGMLMKIRTVRNGVQTATSILNFKYVPDDTSIIESLEYTIDAQDDTVQILFQIDNSIGVVPSDIQFDLVDAYYSVITGVTTNTSAIVANNIKEIVSMNINTIKETILYVKADGSENFSRVIDAVNYITNSSEKNRYGIVIYNGTYDLIAEQGGTTWIQSISLANGERQGLTIPNYTGLEGVGKVWLKGDVSDTIVTAESSRCVSTLNAKQHNTLRNLIVTGTNVRYCYHDEASGDFDFAYREIYNCQFKHYANKAGMWSSIQAYGGGAGSGGVYKYKDSIFESDGTAWSMHNNANQMSNKLDIEGCYFNNLLYGHSMGLGYLGANTERNNVFIKSSIVKADIFVHPEVETGTNNNVWDIYNYMTGVITIGV